MNDNPMPSSWELRAAARQHMRGAWGKMALIYLVYLVIILVPEYIFSESSPLYFPLLDLPLTIASYVVLGPFALGLAGIFLRRIRGEDFSMVNLFDGFGLFLKSFLMTLLGAIFILLWSLLLIVPGIIKGLSYGMTYFVMHDDPGLGPLETLRRSEAMMRGHRWQLFKLQLSFLGWALLCIPTFGIGMLWLGPYIYASTANFYENLKRADENVERPKYEPLTDELSKTQI